VVGVTEVGEFVDAPTAPGHSEPESRRGYPSTSWRPREKSRLSLAAAVRVGHEERNIEAALPTKTASDEGA